MVNPTIFTYPLSGSITNGKFAVVQSINNNVRLLLRENKFGQPNGYGIKIKEEEVSFLLAQWFSIINVNTSQIFNNGNAEKFMVF